ncbi:centromere protein N isoform X2 [Canis lupus baileyi]|uniref:centromere protein N isoform X2 n=1 Tax=Canis lupus familiaris TaxID=9615 RepID=UPI0015F1B61F|nr:centromere protein N isoform X2 [Canis lupus familiaris]XP_025282720.2 centromere protein N isoform X2 [Canis lupus dingo]XP_038394150.1 centromere protein N isoform X2 [Canis lupus familiaris]XP_038522884.1 centromere protein N isoform X2 [Canis lupus familiaris]
MKKADIVPNIVKQYSNHAKEMDETVAEFFKRTILKIPMTEMMTILKAWDFLSEKQLQNVNFRQRKESLVQDLVLLCEKRASVHDAALLDIVYTQFHRHRKVWDVFQMSKGPGEDIDLFDMEQFKSSFKKILQRALKNVMVSFRDAEENAVWIRIAWGTQYRKPNQYKPVYVVYYSQTPYAFTSSCPLRSNIPLLGQALTVASNHHKIVKMDLRSRYLDSLKAIVFKQYNQTFETYNSTTPLQEKSLELDIHMDSRIIHENRIEKERVQRVTQETFGDYSQPRLEFAQYKLETKFKSDFNGDILAERKEPLRCLIKFSSPHLLEALKSLAPAGIADAPLSPLLTCIPNKGMNYFKIKDK